MTSDNRLAKASSDSREDRAIHDRPQTEDRVLNDSVRLEAFKRSYHQSALPDLPEIPGWHVCWLTTTNPRDPIHRRMSWGYVPILSSDMPGWEYASLKTGEYAGCIGVNEMVAFKVPNEIYEEIMLEAHHRMPMEEEQKITSTLDAIREQAERQKSRVFLEEGTAELGKSGKTPTFI